MTTATLKPGRMLLVRATWKRPDWCRDDWCSVKLPNQCRVYMPNQAVTFDPIEGVCWIKARHCWDIDVDGKVIAYEVELIDFQGEGSVDSVPVHRVKEIDG